MAAAILPVDLMREKASCFDSGACEQCAFCAFGVHSECLHSAFRVLQSAFIAYTWPLWCLSVSVSARVPAEHVKMEGKKIA